MSNDMTKGMRLQVEAHGQDASAVGVDPVVQEAMDRWKRVSEWEATWRERFIDDIKFAEADPDNGDQWPAAVKRNRDIDQRPCLTFNLTRQHNKQIINEQLKNKVCMKIRATGGGATVDSANLYEAIVKQIEYRSNAQAAYKLGSSFQVKGGIGWWRVITDYISPESFDQEILIRGVKDPLSIYMDPDCQEEDCSDARFAFVFDLVPQDKFYESYPEFKGRLNLQPFSVSAGDDDWITKDHVRVAEYFRKVETDDELLSFIDPKDGIRKTLLKSKMPKEVYEVLKTQPLVKRRPTKTSVIEWKLIVGTEVADETEWLGKYIPLVRVIGEESVVEGILDRKGHTRYMKDANRMYNYNASAQVEFVALQSKTPYLAAAKAIENYENLWNTANNQNHSVLPFNVFDPEHPDKPLPAPIRQEPPKSASGFAEGMETAFNQMMMTSGQWQNQMGMGGNERTGAAIDKRQQQSDTSVYNFQDAYESALRFTAKICIDLIPKVMDTKRLIKVATDDGEEIDLTLDPKASQMLQVIQDQHGRTVARIMNPTMGTYDVEGDVGPSLGTRRQESAQAMTLILTQAPALTGIIGDLLLKTLDFKEAQEAARRMRRMVPPQALGQGPTPAEQELQARLMSSQAALAKALSEAAKKDLKLVGKTQMRDIDVYKAHTERVKALAEVLPDDPVVLKELLVNLGQDTFEETLKPIVQANADKLAEERGGDAGAEEPGGDDHDEEAPPVPGARKAPDGQWYLTDPTRQGKYLRVAPLAQQHKTPSVIG